MGAKTRAYFAIPMTPVPANFPGGHMDSHGLPTIEKYNRELFRLKASFMSGIFPKEIVIQEKTISVVRHELLMTNVETVSVGEIAGVIFIDKIIFASIKILGKSQYDNLYIRNLHKKEAHYAKALIEGLLLEDEGSINVPSSDFDVNHRRDMLAAASYDPTYRPKLDSLKKKCR
jgi:hypothetical protein